MSLVVDTSIILASLTSEPERPTILKMTQNQDLLAPASVHWEMGNALSAMLKRGRITASQARVVLKNYERIPIRFVEVSLADAVEVAARQNMCAYDAYVIVCARQHRCNLISLDKGLLKAAIDAGVGVTEVPANEGIYLFRSKAASCLLVG